jgi:large-conductance mechanosensitive channel
MLILQTIVGFVIIGGMLYVTILSSKMIDEKKERQRKGLTDYYDNKI